MPGSGRSLTVESTSASGGSVGEDRELLLEASDIVEDRCKNSQTMDIEAFNAIPKFEKEGKLISNY